LKLSSDDRLDILELIARADTAASLRNAEEYISYFTEDASLEGAKGSFQGKDALLRSVMPIWQSEGEASTHLTLNAIVSPVEGQADEAKVTSTLVILRNGPTISIRSTSTIVQLVVKREGAWLIKKRTVL
jgi:hypothetical protein